MTHGFTTAPASLDAPVAIDAHIVDHDSRAGVVARRNVLLGLWAAGRMGLAEGEAEAYAWSVHFADFDAPGHDDVVAKVAGDLLARGVPAADGTIRRQLREMEARAEIHLLHEIR